MNKSPEEADKVEPEDSEAYLKTLTPQEHASRLAEYQVDLDRIIASGERKFDHDKINKMSALKQKQFLASLAQEDKDIYIKEYLADSNKRLTEIRSSISSEAESLFFLWAAVLILAGISFYNILKKDSTEATFFGGLAVLFFFMAIVLYFRKQKTEKVCRECGFTLIKDVFTKKDLMKIWQDINIFRDQPVSLTSRTVTTGIGETVSLNLPDIEAYMARVSYLWGSRRRGRNSKTGQALILEAKENLPYIKIAPKTNFFTGLKFFYKPAKDNMEEIKADRDYNLYCQQERAQTALDILAGVLPQIKKDKFVVEISGKWIVVVKWGYTTNFDKFVNKALPIAKAFDEKYL